MNNVICSYNGQEIYADEIYILADEYINSLLHPEDIYKSNCFVGMLIYLYNNKFKYIITKPYNYSELNDIFFGIYINLCTKYDKTPHLLGFCSLVGMSNSYLTEVMSGTYVDGAKVSPANTETVKNWKKVCESALASKAYDTNGIGAIFGLKAAHGWREMAPAQEPQQITTQATPEQIAERYQDAEKPVLPEF